MMKWCGTLAGLLVTAAGLAGCGGGDNLVRSCDDPQFYQAVAKGERLRVPEGLDELDEYKAMPIPEAAPRPERPPGSPCVDLPPNVLGSSNN